MMRNTTEELARVIHHEYERKAQLKHTFYTPQPWHHIGQVCQDEFINIAAAILAGKTAFRGIEIPQWAIGQAEKLQRS